MMEFVKSHAWKFCKELELDFDNDEVSLTVLSGRSDLTDFSDEGIKAYLNEVAERCIIDKVPRDQWSAALRYIADTYPRVDSLRIKGLSAFDCEEQAVLASRLTLRSLRWDFCKQTAVMIGSNVESLKDVQLEFLEDNLTMKGWRSICSSLSHCHQLTSLYLNIGYDPRKVAAHLAKALKDKANLKKLEVVDFCGEIVEQVLNPSVHRLTHLVCEFESAEALFADDGFADTLRTLEYLDYDVKDYDDYMLEEVAKDVNRDKNLEASVRRLAPKLVQNNQNRRKWCAQ